MIGVFDSGYGGLSILKALTSRLPAESFTYLGDHKNAPYGSRSLDDVYNLTISSVRWLFEKDCKLVILACNTASCILRRIQHEWLPAHYPSNRVLGVVVPTIETVTGVTWDGVRKASTPSPAAKTVTVFATEATVSSNAYLWEIEKRAPHLHVVQQACPDLVQLIESGAPKQEIEAAVQKYVDALKAQLNGNMPDHVLLGCTHYALISDIFRAVLTNTHIVSQTDCVAASLADYLKRHPEYVNNNLTTRLTLFTTGDQTKVNQNGDALFKGSEFTAVQIS